MKEYLIGLIICSLLATIVCFITPGESLRGHQKFVAALCMVCIMAKPIVALVDFVCDFDISIYIQEQSEEDYRDEWEDYLKDYGEGAVEDYVSSELKSTFGVSAKKISVRLRGDTSEPEIERIYIELPQSAAFKDTAKMEIYFEKIFNCEVITAIG